MDRYTRNKKRRESQTQNTSVHKMKLETEILREELNHGVLLVNRMHKERLRLVDAIESEIGKQTDLKERIEFLKNEYTRLQRTLNSNKKILAKTKQNRASLEQTVKKAERTTEKAKISAEAKTIKNNFPKLMNAINKGSFPKEKSILLTSLEKFISTMAENEFEEHSWSAKVVETSERVAARIRFNNIYIREADLKGIYKPIIEDLGKRFGRNSLSIQAKTARKAGVVTCLDLIVKVPVNVKTRALELP